MRRKDNFRFAIAAPLAAGLLCTAPLLYPPPSAGQTQQQPAGVTLAGTLIGPEGEAAAGLDVQLIPVPSSYARRLRELGTPDAVPIIDRTRSDADGHFEFSTSHVGPHQLEVLAAAPDTRPPTVVAPVYAKTITYVPPPAIRIAAAGYVEKRVWLGPQHLQAADRRKTLRIEMRRERRPPNR